MTIYDALNSGNNHIICADDVEFDVKPASDGGYILHHIEKNGTKLAKNRLKMDSRDAETWIKKKHGGIAEIEPGRYEQFIPVPDDEDSLYGDRRSQQSDNDYYDEEDEFEEYEEFEEAPEEEPYEEDDGMPDLSQPSQSYMEGTEAYEEAETVDFEEEDVNSYTDNPNIYTGPEYNEEPYMADTSDKFSVIYEDMTMTGDIVTQGSVEVYGAITGNIHAGINTIITGYVHGDIISGNLYINGSDAEVVGNISTNDMRITRGAVVIGDIVARNLIVEGCIKGDIDVQGRVILRNTAIVKGNIASYSIIIDEGARTDGYNVQKYAEDAPNNFFSNYQYRMGAEADTQQAQASQVVPEAPVILDETRIPDQEQKKSRRSKNRNKQNHQNNQYAEAVQEQASPQETYEGYEETPPVQTE